MSKLTVVFALVLAACAPVEYVAECHGELWTIEAELAEQANDNETLRLSLLATQAENDALRAALVFAIDANHDGRITCAEAEAAGIETPVTSDHPVYAWMDDRDGDFEVCE